MKTEISNRQIRGFYFIHVLGTFGLIALLSLVLGCEKAIPPEDEIKDGPQVAAEALVSAMDGAKQDRNLLDAEADDFVVYETTARPFTSSPQILGYDSQQVMSKNDLGDRVEIVIRNRSFDQDGKLTAEDGETCQVLKANGDSDCSSSLATKSVPTKASPFDYDGSLASKTIRSLEVTQDTFHNFSFSYQTMPAPALVAAKPDCAGLRKCQFRTIRIEFDIVSRKDGLRSKRRFTLDYSIDTPYLGTLLSQCVRGNEIFENRQVPITQCRLIYDLKFGKKTEAPAEPLRAEIEQYLQKQNLVLSKPGETASHGEYLQDGILDPILSLRKLLLKQWKTPDIAVLQEQHFTMEGLLQRSKSYDCLVSTSGAAPGCGPLPMNEWWPPITSDTKIHNLNKASYRWPAPDAVKSRPGCEGLPNCEYSVQLYRFWRTDIVDGQPETSLYTLEFSPDLPPLAALSFGCRRTMASRAPSSTRQCQVLTDFKFSN